MCLLYLTALAIDPDVPDDPRELFQRLCREVPQFQDSYTYTYAQEGTSTYLRFSVSPNCCFT